MILKTPYQCRPIRFLELVEHRGWRIKLYGIRYGGSRVEPDEILVESARRQVLDALPLPAVTDQRYGVGFLIIHQGQHNNWFLLDWWFEQEILKQKLFYSPPSDSTTHRTSRSRPACLYLGAGRPRIRTAGMAGYGTDRYGGTGFKRLSDTTI